MKLTAPIQDERAQTPIGAPADIPRTSRPSAQARLGVDRENLRLGVVNPETWDFFKELFDYFGSRFQTSLFDKRELALPVFRGRAERYLLRRDLLQFLRRNDVVFFEWASDLLALATEFPKSARIITRLHRWELYAWADAVNWDAVDRIILVSEAKRREFSERFPAHASKIEVVPESIDLERFRYKARSFSGSIGTLCHLRPRKRVYDLILSFSELRRTHPNLTLHIGGNPVPEQMDYYASLKSLAERLSLGGSIQFDGFVERPWEWYRKIDVFVSNSYSEGLQVSPMEAMASGCFTLVHRWEGADELLPPEYLYFSDSELQAKIRTFCDASEEDRLRQRERQRAIVEGSFDIAVNRERIGRMVEELGNLS